MLVKLPAERRADINHNKGESKMKESKMFVAKLYNETKIYDVDMDDFGWIDDEDTDPADAQISKDDGMWPVLSYHDGNNWKLEFLQTEPEEVCFEMAAKQPEQPGYFGIKKIIIGDEEIEISTSNTSGGITPYWTEMSY